MALLRGCPIAGTARYAPGTAAMLKSTAAPPRKRAGMVTTQDDRANRQPIPHGDAVHRLNGNRLEEPPVQDIVGSCSSMQLARGLPHKGRELAGGGVVLGCCAAKGL